MALDPGERIPISGTTGLTTTTLTDSTTDSTSVAPRMSTEHATTDIPTDAPANTPAGGLADGVPGEQALSLYQAAVQVDEHAVQVVLPGPVDTWLTRQTVAQLGALVTEAASALVLDDRRWRSARRTQLRQHDDLVRFARFLAELATHAGLPFADPATYAERLATDLNEWQSITWGHLQAHMAWLLDSGYAIGTIDNALSTLKIYARLAQRAGALAAEDLTRILDLHPFGYRGGLTVNDHRPADKRRRPGAKKSQPTAITIEEAQVLKTVHPDDPRGRRDALLLALLIDHGLRVGEVVALQLEDIAGIESIEQSEVREESTGASGDHYEAIQKPGESLTAPTDKLSGQDAPTLSAGRSRLGRTGRTRAVPAGAARFLTSTPPMVLLRVHRPKVKKEQRHALTPDCVVALRRYLEVRRTVEPATSGPLLCATHPHHPALVVAGMTENGIHKRVKSLGRELLGVDNLGPHDLRHFWATSAARGKTSFDRLVRAGGWNSPAMPLRYIDAEEVANTGVVLDHLRPTTAAPLHLPRRDPAQ